MAGGTALHRLQPEAFGRLTRDLRSKVESTLAARVLEGLYAPVDPVLRRVQSLPEAGWAGVLLAFVFFVGAVLWLRARTRGRPAPPDKADTAQPALAKPVRPHRWRAGRILLGIDPGTDSLKITVAAHRRGSLAILAQIAVPVQSQPHGDTGRDPASLLAGLPQALAQVGVRRVRGILSLDQHGVILRVPEFPPMPAKELRRAVEFAVPDLIPIPAGEVVWDAVPANPERTGGANRRVLVAAAPLRLVIPHVEAAMAAGVRVTAVDVDCLAAYRALTYLGLLPEGRGPLVLADFGASATRLSIFIGGVPELTRTIPRGGNDLTRAIEDAFAVSAEEARSRKERGHLFDDSPLSAVLEPVLADLFDEMWRTLEYFLRQARPSEAVPIFLYGGTSRMAGLGDRLGRFLEARVRERFGMHPGFAVRCVGELTPDTPDSVDPRFLVALGLAVEAGSADAPPLRVNLLPNPWREAGRRRVRQAAAALLVAAGLGGLAGGWALLRVAASRLETRLRELSPESAVLAEAVRLREKVQAAERLQAARAEFLAAQKENGKLSDLLAALPGQLPAGVAVDRLEVTGDGRVVLEGRAPDVRSVAQLVVNLRNGGRFGAADVRFPDRFVPGAGEAADSVRFVVSLAPAGKDGEAE